MARPSRKHNERARSPQTQFLIDVITAVMKANMEAIIVLLQRVRDGITYEALERIHRRYGVLAAEINRSVDHLENIHAEETRGCGCGGTCRREYRRIMSVIRPPTWSKCTHPVPRYCESICEKAPPIIQDS